MHAVTLARIRIHSARASAAKPRAAPASTLACLQTKSTKSAKNTREVLLASILASCWKTGPNFPSACVRQRRVTAVDHRSRAPPATRRCACAHTCDSDSSNTAQKTSSDNPLSFSSERLNRASSAWMWSNVRALMRTISGSDESAGAGRSANSSGDISMSSAPSDPAMSFAGSNLDAMGATDAG